MQVLVLAGGKGERLKTLISDVPKPMALVNDIPFLEYLIYQIKSWQIDDIIISIGYKGQVIKDYFKDGSKWGVKISYAEENEPLGTGGAIKYALTLIKSFPIIVMNGDSFFDVDMKEMFEFHKKKSSLITIAGVLMNDTGRFGSLLIDEDCKIISFYEKKSDGKGIINGGIYLLEKALVEDIPLGFVSIERDVFHKYIGRGFYSFVVDGFFIDIGIPEDYVWLKKNSKKIFEAFKK